MGIPNRHTRTYVCLPLSKAAFEEIQDKMKEAGYNHAFSESTYHGTVIDMHGIAVAKDQLEGEGQ